jgi:Ca-activated chloride channel family protein
MTFEWAPALLGLLIMPILAALYIYAQRRRKQFVTRYSNLDTLKKIAPKQAGWRKHIPPILFLIGLTALLFALARPISLVSLPREQANVMLVIDASASMRVNDLQPTRLDAAKDAARGFVESLPPQLSVGVVSFNAKANVNAPLTRDRSAVISAINNLKTDNGTAIGDGLLLALNTARPSTTLRSAQDAPTTFVLISDGESREGEPPLQVAPSVKQAGIVVHTVGIGQRGARVVFEGAQTVGLDETTLQQIARETGGRYFYAEETSQLRQIYRELSTQVGFVQERQEVTALFVAVGVAFLVVAAALSLLWFQRMM